MQLGHDLAGRQAVVELELHLPERLAPPGALLAQLHEARDARHAARAPRLDALAHPHLLLREQLVGACAGQCLGFQLALLGRLEGREVTGIGAQLSAVELDDARGHRIEKGAIVRDQEQRTAKIIEQILQPQDGVEVEMVGRLVEQQHLGRRDQRLCQRDALLRAAAQ